MLCCQGDHHGRVFRALALVDRRRVGEHQLIEFAKAVCNFAAVEVGDEFALLDIDGRDNAEIRTARMPQMMMPVS